MKKRMMVTVVMIAAMIGGGSGAVLAGHGPGNRACGSRPGMEMGPGKFEARMTKELKLTESQQSQVKAIYSAERERNKELFDKMHEIRKQLMQMADASNFDETAVRAAAAEQAKIQTELIVSRTIAHHQTNMLLTTEQRELAKKLREKMDRRHAPPID